MADTIHPTTKELVETAVTAIEEKATKKTSVLDRLKAQKEAGVSVSGRAKSGKTRPKARLLSESQDLAIKWLIYGPTGVGKTFTIVGLLQAGERVFVLSTDFGSNGLLTVTNELKRIGQTELKKNLYYLDLSDYEQIMEFLDNPLLYVPDLNEFNPTVVMWEGFTSFNADIADEYILSLAPSMDTEKSNASGGELREEGLLTNLQDWAGIKRATTRAIRKFLALRLPADKPIHKVMTTLESVAKLDKLNNEVAKGPLVQGGGRDLQPPAFDIITQLHREEKDGKISYWYRTLGASGKFVLKSRGFDVEPDEPADPKKFWLKLKASLE